MLRVDIRTIRPSLDSGVGGYLQEDGLSKRGGGGLRGVGLSVVDIVELFVCIALGPFITTSMFVIAKSGIC